MKLVRKAYKIICLSLALLAIFCIQTTTITSEVKATNTNPNKNVNLTAMARVIETFAYNDINTVLDSYYGTLTGYVANCPLCTGKLSCNGQSVLDGTTTYLDSTYGTVNIVASSSNLPCGTIVRFKKASLSDDYITAIVLDRGVTGTSLDLLVESENTAIMQVGSNKVSYDVLRYGWSR